MARGVAAVLVVVVAEDPSSTHGIDLDGHVFCASSSSSTDSVAAAASVSSASKCLGTLPLLF